MAIKARSVSNDSMREMTLKEFKQWLKKFDSDKDGRISEGELADAVRLAGGWFARWKGKHGMQSADANGNGFIDETEINNLVAFAQKNLGIKIIDLRLL